MKNSQYLVSICVEMSQKSQHIELKKDLFEAYMLGKKDEALNVLASQPTTESFKFFQC